MKTRDLKYIVIALFIVLGVGVVGIVVRSRVAGNGEPPEGGESLAVKYEALAQSECEAIRAEIDLHRERLFFITEDGTGVMIPVHDYPKDSPLLIVCPMQRTADGAIEPFEPNAVSFRAADVSYRSPGSFDLNGAKRLCIPVTKEFVHIALEAGREYLVRARTLQGTIVMGVPYQTTLKIPNELENGKVYQIQVVLRDLLKEKTDAERLQAEAERLRRLSEEEKITVRVTPVPESRFVVMYDDGVRSREGSPAESGGDVVVMKGPNKLGGELAVFLTKAGAPCWAYIKSLDKRTITLPKDADIVISEDRLVELPVSMAKEDLPRLSKYKAIAFYGSADGKYPLFRSSLRKLAFEDPNAPKVLSVKILPGTYHVRVGTPRKDETSIGTVTIKGRDPGPFSIELPD